MKIDDSTYQLPLTNFHAEETIKKQIIIGHTSNNNMNHYKGWLHRFNGNYKKTAPFTISTNGTIHKHFEPIYYSDIFYNTEIDSKAILILLENDGWLTKNTETKEFLTSLGNIYNQSNEVFLKKWREKTYWSNYNEKQIDSLVELVRYLSNEFFIPFTNIADNNMKMENADNYNGILYRSNFHKNYTDLSPAFPFLEFKNKI
jgi:hypothetical protein